MTRLITKWIAEMEEQSADWNDALRERIGLDFIGLASRVSGKDREAIERAALAAKVAVVPITSGLGTIDSFSESVAAIVRAMGFHTFVTERTDVNGIYEAHVKDADIIFMADDDRYIALNLHNGRIGDNNIATAGGYAEVLLALSGLSNGAKGTSVAVLGFGIIGQLMASYLREKGACVSVYDKKPAKREAVAACGYEWIESAEALKKFQYIADGTSEGAWIHEGLLREDVIIAAPGVPFSLNEAAKKRHEGNYVHDVLEIGTACMVGLAL